jgi:hypothetical protein
MAIFLAHSLFIKQLLDMLGKDCEFCQIFVKLFICASTPHCVHRLETGESTKIGLQKNASVKYIQESRLPCGEYPRESELPVYFLAPESFFVKPVLRLKMFTRK